MIEGVADWTAITGIVVAGVVGPAVAGGIALWQQGRGQSHERELLDLAELRGIIDQAGVNLREALGFRGRVASDFITHGKWIVERAPETLEAYREAVRLVDLDQTRIAIRLGKDHPVTVAHAEALEALSAAYTAAFGLRSDLSEASDVKEAWAVFKDVESATAPRERFMIDAKKLVGARTGD
jgi:hypothetical protein